MANTLVDIPKNFSNIGKDVFLLNSDYAIVEEVKNILNTQLEERLLNMGFGTQLHDYLFMSMSQGIITIIRKIIKEVILSNCKNVYDVSSYVTVKDDALYIKLILTTALNKLETETRFYLR